MWLEAHGGLSEKWALVYMGLWFEENLAWAVRSATFYSGVKAENPLSGSRAASSSQSEA